MNKTCDKGYSAYLEFISCNNAISETERIEMRLTNFENEKMYAQKRFSSSEIAFMLGMYDITLFN